MPNAADAARRARTRMMLIVNGFFDMAVAGFFLGWGAQVLEIERPTAYLIAAVLAASGVVSFFIATLAYGRKGQGRALDQGEDEPVIRR